MKLSLPLRIFSFHLVFMVVFGAFGALLVRRAFESYEARWKQELETVPAENLFSPLASELARSLLLRLEGGLPEPQQVIKRSVAEGLGRVLPTIPSIERLIIVDSEGVIHYADGPLPPGPVWAPGGPPAPDPSGEPVRRRVRLEDGGMVDEVLLPVLADPRAPPGDERRLGWALVRYGGEADSTSQELLDPWVAVVARALLDAPQRSEGEGQEAFRESVSDGLNRIIAALPLERLLIVDNDLRIQYVNDTKYLDLAFVGEEGGALFAGRDPRRRRIELGSGQPGVEVMLPIFERGEDGGERRRLGSVLIHYVPDPGLAERIPDLRPPTVRVWDYLQPLVLFLVLGVGGGILLAALTGLPVRRLERAVADFSARGFKGGLDRRKARLPADLEGTIRAISEMGGRLEALDEQGRAREALLETLSHSLEDAMIAVDPGGQPVAWNQAALRILAGARPDDAPDAEPTQTQAEILQRALQRNPDLQFAMNRVEIGAAREVPIVQDHGSAVARVTQVPFELRPGVTGTLLLLRDVQALREVETHLLDAGRFATLAHLAAGLAHEIRNPLHAIQLNAGVVEEYQQSGRAAADSRAVADSLTTIQDEAQRLTVLLNNYLGLVHPGDHVGPVDLYEVGRRVIQLVAYAAQKSHVELRLIGEQKPPLVQGLTSRLQQAVLNLVLNAIQAMPGGGTLTLRVSSDADLVRLSVADTGPGLPQHLADKLFDTRVTTKPEGSGLGLPLVRLIMESHGGGVWYRSTPGKGTSFTIALPVREQAPLVATPGVAP